MKLDKRTIKILAVLIAFGVGLSWLLNHLDVAQGVLGTVWGLIYPFFLGLIIAFVLNIPMNFLERVLFRGHGGKAKRPLSLVLTIVLVLAVLAFVIFMVVPQLVETIGKLISNMPAYLQNLQDMLKPYEKYWPDLQNFISSLNLDWEQLGKELVAYLQTGAGAFFSSAWDVAFSIVSGTVSFFIGVIFAVYVLLAKEKLHHQAKGLLRAYLPEKGYDKVMEISSLSYRTFSQFVAGQCTEAVVVGTLFCILLWLFQFQYALLIGVLIGFMSLIPVFGTTIACIIGALLILMAQGFWPAIMFVILFLVVQQIDGNLIYPHIVGNSVGLPAIWVMVAVLVGGNLMGISGMLFFIPLSSVIYALVRQNAKKRLVVKGVLSQEEAERDTPEEGKPKKRGWFARRKKEEAPPAPKPEEEEAAKPKKLMGAPPKRKK